MPILIGIAIYAVIIARRPIDKCLKKRHVGPLAMASGGVVWLRGPRHTEAS
ncbi:MAG TPA: hypothetical protein VLM11_11925 [Streptosporangiaceae bacterium]|nr:hypothetical protein [Streptosporangiaceae bacterium]